MLTTNQTLKGGGSRERRQERAGKEAKTNKKPSFRDAIDASQGIAGWTHSLGWLFPVSLSTTSDFSMCGFACRHRCSGRGSS